MSYGKNRTTQRAIPYTENVIDAHELFIAAVRSVPVKHICVPGILSESTVEAWRVGQKPRFDKAMFAAQRVTKIKSAVLEILGVEMPDQNRVIAKLLCCLADIVSEGDEISAARAKLALAEFAGSEP